MELTAAEIARRQPVWEVLSEFWLDTELDERDWRRAAEVFTASGYSLDEIREIHAMEVAPVLWANLLPVAGEWAGFNQDWLAAEILRRTHGRRRLFRLWRKLGLFDLHIERLTGHHWRRVVEIMRSKTRA